MTNPNQAPGFIDHVPSQAELVADAAVRAEQMEKLAEAQPIAAVREAMAAAGIELDPAAQAEIRQPYVPPVRVETPAPVHEPYEESEVEKIRMTKSEVAKAIQAIDQK